MCVQGQVGGHVPEGSASTQASAAAADVLLHGQRPQLRQLMGEHLIDCYYEYQE